MGLFQDIKNALKASGGNVTLKDAGESASQLVGCYKIFHKNRLKYVGVAERSIRKKLRAIYIGTNVESDPGLQLVYENREIVTVSWSEFESKKECEEVKKNWIKKYRPEWNIIKR